MSSSRLSEYERTHIRKTECCLNCSNTPSQGRRILCDPCCLPAAGWGGRCAWAFGFGRALPVPAPACRLLAVGPEWIQCVWSLPCFGFWGSTRGCRRARVGVSQDGTRGLIPRHPGCVSLGVLEVQGSPGGDVSLEFLWALRLGLR